jgi:hypothetical protein
MNTTKVITDIVLLISKGGALPSSTDREAVKAYAVAIVPGLIDLGYDAMGLQVAAGEFKAMSPKEIKKCVCDTMPAEKIGDGTILKFLQSVDWGKLISEIGTIIAFLPK